MGPFEEHDNQAIYRANSVPSADDKIIRNQSELIMDLVRKNDRLTYQLEAQEELLQDREIELKTANEMVDYRQSQILELVAERDALNENLEKLHEKYNKLKMDTDPDIQALRDKLMGPADDEDDE